MRMRATTSEKSLAHAIAPSIAKADGYITVRRTGHPPLRFLGELMICETSHRTGTRLWYEINIYRRAKSGYVCEVKQFVKSGGQHDRFNAQQCANVGDIITYLETYKFKDDLTSNIAVDDANKHTCDLVLEAIELRQHIHEAKLEFGYAASLVFDTLIEYDLKS
jgi:hypothetical protein